MLIFMRMIGDMVKWLERRDCDRHGLGSKPNHAIFSCFGCFGKQFQISVISLSNFKQAVMS